MAQLFRYPLTLGSGEREGNQHIITFVAGGNNGAVYKADNWKQIGETAGLPKDRKAFSVKWDSAEHLKETFLPPTGEDKKLIFICKLK